jgi:UDP-N-acetylmuramoylalanine--D-glutamate ligase
MGVDIEGVREGLKSFPGVPHRLERVDEVNGVAYINDSKATNPAAAAAAIRSFDPPVRVIVGGSSKGGQFTELVEAVKERGASCYLVGDAAEQIDAELRAGELSEQRSQGTGDAETASDQVTITREPGLEHAVRAATADASPGDVVLLAPACASFDAYPDFEARGEHFRLLVAAQADAARSQ